VLASAVLVEPGTRLRLPPTAFISRHAYVICGADDADGCVALLDDAMSEVRLTAQPLLPVASGG
jgi:hypothetical protein